MEAERNEVEADWSRKLEAKAREADRLRAAVDSSARSQQSNEDVVGKLSAEIGQLKEEVRAQSAQVSQWQLKAEQLGEAEVRCMNYCCKSVRF